MEVPATEQAARSAAPRQVGGPQRVQSAEGDPATVPRGDRAGDAERLPRVRGAQVHGPGLRAAGLHGHDRGERDLVGGPVDQLPPDAPVGGVDQLVVGQPRRRQGEDVASPGGLLAVDHEVAAGAGQAHVGQPTRAGGERRAVDGGALDGGHQRAAGAAGEHHLVDAGGVDGEGHPGAVRRHRGLPVLTRALGEGEDLAGGQVEQVQVVGAGTRPVGREHQPGPVRQPPRLPVVVGAGGVLGQPAAVGTHRPQVEVAVPVGLERDRPPVRRPGGPGGVLQVVGEPAGRAAAGGQHPDRHDQVEGELLPAGCGGDHDVGALPQRRGETGHRPRGRGPRDRQCGGRSEQSAGLQHAPPGDPGGRAGYVVVRALEGVRHEVLLRPPTPSCPRVRTVGHRASCRCPQRRVEGPSRCAVAGSCGSRATGRARGRLDEATRIADLPLRVRTRPASARGAVSRSAAVRPWVSAPRVLASELPGCP